MYIFYFLIKHLHLLIFYSAPAGQNFLFFIKHKFPIEKTDQYARTLKLLFKMVKFYNISFFLIYTICMIFCKNYEIFVNEFEYNNRTRYTRTILVHGKNLRGCLGTQLRKAILG